MNKIKDGKGNQIGWLDKWGNVSDLLNRNIGTSTPSGSVKDVTGKTLFDIDTSGQIRSPLHNLINLGSTRIGSHSSSKTYYCSVCGESYGSYAPRKSSKCTACNASSWTVMED